jgi:hypothetical protein
MSANVPKADFYGRRYARCEPDCPVPSLWVFKCMVNESEARPREQLFIRSSVAVGMIKGVARLAACDCLPYSFERDYRWPSLALGKRRHFNRYV